MSQKTDILKHMGRKPITPLEALNNYGCLRLAARINDLRQEGHKINCKMVKKGKKSFASYTLETE